MDLHTQTIYSLRLYNLKIELSNLQKQFRTLFKNQHRWTKKYLFLSEQKKIHDKIKKTKKEIDRLNQLLEL